MDPVALWVTVGGVALALAVNLYFFSPRRAVVARPAPVVPPAQPATSALAPQPPASAAARPAGVAMPVTIAAPAPQPPPLEAPQEARITVRGGYEPSVIEVRVGRPVRLTFYREETEGCSDTVLLPEWRIFHHLPAHEDTVVEFTPEHTGEFEFTCGMQMMRGKIVVR